MKSHAETCYSNMTIDFPPHQASLSSDVEGKLLQYYLSFKDDKGQLFDGLIEFDVYSAQEPLSSTADIKLTKERLIYIKRLFVQFGANPNQLYDRYDLDGLPDDSLFDDAVDIRLTPKTCGRAMLPQREKK